MTASTDWGARAALCELLAFGFAYPDARLAYALVTGELEEAVWEAGEALGFDVADACAALHKYETVDERTALKTLRVEATHLFVQGTEVPVYPYESQWVDVPDEGRALMFVSKVSEDVERAMRAAGVVRAGKSDEPADYLVSELEFLMCLARMAEGSLEKPASLASAEDAYRAFSHKHVQRWVPAFAETVRERAREPYYRVFGMILLQACECAL